MKEVYKPVLGYEGIYEISNLGNLKSLERIVLSKRGYNLVKKEKISKGTINSRGYNVVGLYRNGIQKKETIHFLVCEAFLNHRKNNKNLVVNHKDFNKNNNCLSNLEIVTQRDNTNKKHVKSSSKYTGVSFKKSINKYVSRIYKNNKSKHLGYFNNEIDASIAYEKELLKLINI